MTPIIPERLVASCQTPGRAAWLAQLPGRLRDLAQRWSLSLGEPFEGDEVTCAWVAPVTLADGGTAVLKIGQPHMEADHEIAGLRFWNGDPTVRLLEADEALGAMLLERCEPGAHLRLVPEPEQDAVIARLLRRLWRPPGPNDPFRPLSVMLTQWSAETRARSEDWPDASLVRQGLQLFEELSQTTHEDVVLATDLHAGNVLRSQREPWLVIDPKPFVGDPAYDATQHLLNCRERLRADPHGTIKRFVNILDVDAERVRLWTFARLVAEPRDDWDAERPLTLARLIQP